MGFGTLSGCFQGMLPIKIWKDTGIGLYSIYGLEAYSSSTKRNTFITVTVSQEVYSSMHA